MLSIDQLRTIQSLLSSLNYYQILKISPVAGEREIRDAFHREAFELHPDQYFAQKDGEALQLSRAIYAKVVEAYQTLSNREKRASYDKSLHQGHKALNELERELFDDQNEITAVKPKVEGNMSTAGSRFFRLAQAAFTSRDLQAAKMNIQIALNADPYHPEYLELDERIKMELQKLNPEKQKK